MVERDYATPFSVLRAASMLSHHSRLAKFNKALQTLVNEDSYVVDIGTGTGVLAFMAARAGARRVTGIDINGRSVEYARKAARENQLDGVVDFRTLHFSDFSPDIPADIVICEMLSAIMLIEQQIPASRNAVHRILASNGVILPQSVTVYVVPVECGSVWERFQVESLHFPKVPQTVDRSTATDLSDLAILTEFDLFSEECPTRVDKTLEFTVVDEGVVHGLVGLFEAQLYNDIVLRMEDGWRELFIPFEEPIEVSRDDLLRIRLRYVPGVYDSLSVENLEDSSS
ncbi:MAG: 50S ribosomal protein L11 methyltransferase [Candidatus Thorarchaeota archaeon]